MTKENTGGNVISLEDYADRRKSDDTTNTEELETTEVVIIDHEEYQDLIETADIVLRLIAEGIEHDPKYNHIIKKDS